MKLLRLFPIQSSSSLSILEEVYEQGVSVSRYFFSMVALICLHGASLEYMRDNSLLLYLDLISVFFCILALCARLIFHSVFWRRTLVICVLATIMLIEVETQFHDNEFRFSEPEMWVLDPVILLLIGFFLPARPSLFVGFILMTTAYYLGRVAMISPEEFQKRGLWVILADMVAINGFSILLNRWWFFYRFDSIRKSRLLHERVGQERESVFRDIHDHIGANILDLKRFAEKLQNSSEWNANSAKDLESLVGKISLGIRTSVSLWEDSKLLSEDLWMALRVILLKRYELFQRKIGFEKDGDSIFALAEADREDFLGIIVELSSNDLKYGSEESIWGMDTSDESKIRIYLKTGSKYDPRKEVEGSGKKTILQRAKNIGGSWSESYEKGIYLGELTLPLNRGGWVGKIE
ncbi:hypothetical protein EHQ53_09365 [Leptospira langatensis]|uniref:Histidine kinase n=1 Tax=Leptospira langatensis TaxID=2484983 RepID=A0A5F1ZV91_9LEPT|nr:hypothetical protein [Leptospira langatensis]TGK01175.1 hypothetical protein EHO57_09510 [Leptospira langatensis]TGL42373.1 hypothetical protein EHQ53_09365 [Leptospira langatensis]